MKKQRQQKVFDRGTENGQVGIEQQTIRLKNKEKRDSDAGGEEVDTTQATVKTIDELLNN